MKRILTAIVLFALVVLPMSVMAMTSISDNELSSVTGQAGVSIGVDVTAQITVGTVAWGDSDGLGTTSVYSLGGFVGIEGLTLTAHVSGRHDGVFGADTTAGTEGYVLNDPITIDVATAASTVATAGITVGDSIVRIGLPTAEIQVGTLSTSVFVSGVAAGIPGTHQTLGSLYIGSMEILMGTSTTPTDGLSYDAGYVTIGAASTAANSGVKLGLAVKIDEINLTNLSWGNTTSVLYPYYGAATSAGYIGLQSLSLTNVGINGVVVIGVGSLNLDAVYGGTVTPALGNHAMVNIAIPALTVTVPNGIAGTVVLARDNVLSTGVETLGNFYIGSLTLNIIDNVGSPLPSATSNIKIYAH